MVTVEIEGDRFTGRQSDRAHACDNHSGVAHFRCEQRDIAAQSGVELAFVDDAASGTIAIELQLAGHEVRIADATGGRSEAAYVHHSALTEIHAVRIGQKDLARRVDPAEDLARIAVQNAVEGGRIGARLVEIDLRGAAEVERIPVDYRALARLVDVEHRRVGCAR